MFRISFRKRTSMDFSVSIVEFTGESNTNHCGYCKTTAYDKFSHGMWAHQMSVDDYNALLDRGWRRSGKYTYKPTLNRTCCPQYTIRCDASTFYPSKRQKRVLKSVYEYLATGKKPKKYALSSTDGYRADVIQAPSIETSGVVDAPTAAVSPNLPTEAPPPSAQEPKHNETKKEMPTPKTIENSASKKQPRLGKKKEMRKQRALERLAKKGIDFETAQKMRQAKMPRRKSLEDFMEKPMPAEPAHRLELRLVRSHPVSREFSETLEESHSVYMKYQTVVHRDPPSQPTLRQFCRFLCDSPLNIRCLRVESIECKALLDESYSLYRRYQTTVHDDYDCDQDSYTDFLISSPLNEKPAPSGGSDHPGYGSFHQQYILDGKIIAVGVLDILPHCVSAKYFYYDPDFQFLSLGTYSALVEIALVRKLTRTAPELHWYYMGFYIDSCPKMRYKGRFLPSDLLCPETFVWIPIEKCLPKLAVSKYARFAEGGQPNIDDNVELDQVGVLYKRASTTYGLLRLSRKNRAEDDSDDVRTYARLVGPECSKRMLLFRSE